MKTATLDGASDRSADLGPPTQSSTGPQPELCAGHRDPHPRPDDRASSERMPRRWPLTEVPRRNGRDRHRETQHSCSQGLPAGCCRKCRCSLPGHHTVRSASTLVQADPRFNRRPLQCLTPARTVTDHQPLRAMRLAGQPHDGCGRSRRSTHLVITHVAPRLRHGRANLAACTCKGGICAVLCCGSSRHNRGSTSRHAPDGLNGRQAEGRDASGRRWQPVLT